MFYPRDPFNRGKQQSQNMRVLTPLQSGREVAVRWLGGRRVLVALSRASGQAEKLWVSKSGGVFSGVLRLSVEGVRLVCWWMLRDAWR